MKIFFVICIVGLLLLVALKLDLPLSSNEIAGTYVNKNFTKICGAEISNKPDTLHLYPNSKFKSGFYGVGTYKIKDGWPQSIKLTYHYEYGKADFTANFSSTIFEPIKIMTNYDLDCYYEKVK